MLTPQQFAQKCGISYNQVLNMCKRREINALKTDGGHFKIPEKELDRFKNSDYVTKEEYLRVIRENEELKTIIKNCMNLLSFINNL
ncbi:helix-turn-helix domain-containing protein [Clostridium botulinum]|uniref:Helix-turn-helix domain-containing protein n=1 Tax=Clostridium botulinum TaxID=1491 RepID=A0A6B4UBW9_CLOBO|nr:helix-turn-helix domain-containing protein [Clostridium botulinum]NFD83594.1 helix-turn-helix domain-containing protein [Clostridium botulinum]NFE08335.1 helix-turn-helix domain-containing protein [Clostridium botulinum]NFE34175.1 helix-turn-helix domain-containing protein [Clostridium botulinum]NFE50173.1 helix-turn-helix domain-containing protein [Clostridium botulinum]